MVGIFEGPRKIEQLIRVVGRFDSGVQNEIIAGAFNLLAHTPCCDPSKGMEPIEGPRHLGTDLQQPIPRAICESSCESTIRLRSSDHSEATAGSRMSGRKIPQVSGMDN